MAQPISSWHRINALDLRLCVGFNRFSRFGALRWFFCGVSRLGNGVFWYALTSCLPLMYGMPGLLVVLRMLIAGLGGLLVYKWLKTRTARPRPFEVYAAVAAKAPVLDQFSFPSGHTLHAVAFSCLLSSGLPELGLIAWPFTLLVAVSRPLLGLHYPSDVLAGAALGFGMAQLVLMLV